MCLILIEIIPQSEASHHCRVIEYICHIQYLFTSTMVEAEKRKQNADQKT